jgi:threonylcarbamoyladenosine tRNA methylthiotransferase MtaB
MKTVKFYTLGCKVNQYDTQSIRERFFSRGYKEITNGTGAGVCLINTCTVTRAADQKSRSIIRRLSRENPRARIIVTGCLVKDHEALAGIKGIDYLIDKRFFPDGISDFSGHARAFLKIQDGCDNSCAYCKVPLVRGRSRSRPHDEIIEEARRLACRGFKEIVLTGICLGVFGRDLIPKTSLVRLISRLEKIPGLERIRLSSIEAGDVTAGLIRKISRSRKLCPHLHIPIQSGDDGILNKMRRKYSRKDYLDLIKRLRRKIPDIAVTTDIIVGFPGESEENFRNTLNLVKAIRPLKVHIFPYSAREGVESAGYKDEVPVNQVKDRLERLERLNSRFSEDFRKRFKGKKVRVLFENRVAGSPDCWEGYTGNYLKVSVKSRRDLRNKLLEVIFA